MVLSPEAPGMTPNDLDAVWMPALGDGTSVDMEQVGEATANQVLRAK